MRAVLERFLEDRAFDAQQFIARPIARPRKQRYTARHYPAGTPAHAPYERIRGAVRRRVRVNRGLAVSFRENSMNSQVVRSDQPMPEQVHMLVTIGTLCEGKRNSKSVVGIVSAVHSTGRLTLLVPERTSLNAISWRRVVIVPSVYLRILSTDRVIFLSSPF